MFLFGFIIGNGLNLLSGSTFSWNSVHDNCKNAGCFRLGVGKNPNPFSYSHQYEDIFLNSKAPHKKYQNGNGKQDEDALKKSIIWYLKNLTIKYYSANTN